MDIIAIKELLGITSMTDAEIQNLIIVLLSGSFIFLLIMGITNRVVVFAHGNDFALTLGVYFVPIMVLIIQTFLSPENTPDEYNILWDSSAHKAVSLVGAVFFTYCFIMTFVYSVRYNGVIIGVILGFFKVMSALIILLFSIGYINKLTDGEYKSIGTWILMVLVLGIFGWVVKKLINGEAVAKRRLSSA